MAGMDLGGLYRYVAGILGLTAWYFVTSSSPIPLPQPNANTAVSSSVYHGPYKDQAECEQEQRRYDNVTKPCHEEEDSGGS